MMYDELRSAQRGQSLSEYALVLVLVGIVVIVALAAFGTRVQKTYCEIVFSVNPNAEAPFCEALDVTCVQSHSPFRLEATVQDNAGENNITKVMFYRNGLFQNEELHYRYCLAGGDGECAVYTGPTGQQTFKAIAYDLDGNTGSCEVTVNLP
jgi:hypothetical protein